MAEGEDWAAGCKPEELKTWSPRPLHLKALCSSQNHQSQPKGASAVEHREGLLSLSMQLAVQHQSEGAQAGGNQLVLPHSAGAARPSFFMGPKGYPRHAHVCTQDTHTFKSLHAPTHAYTQACTHPHTCTYPRTHDCTHPHICTRTTAHAQLARTHTHIHAQPHMYNLHVPTSMQGVQAHAQILAGLKHPAQAVSAQARLGQTCSSPSRSPVEAGFLLVWSRGWANVCVMLDACHAWCMARLVHCSPSM